MLKKWFFLAGLVVILVISAGLLLLSYRFSLPYVDHVDEPAYYLGGQEWRGLYDSGGYYKGIPPAYVAINAWGQPLLESVGIRDLAGTVEVLRLLSVVVNLGSLIFIALIARLAAGDLAGLVAGAAWGIAPAVLENGVYALPDPHIYFFTLLALWLAVVALIYPERRAWLIASTIAGLLAVLMKYPALPALIPGVLVTLLLLIRERKGWRLLFAQIALIGLTGFWLVFIYGIDFNNLQREGATVQQQGMQNLFDFGRVFHNIYQTFVPINAPAFFIIFILGIAAYFFARRQKLPLVRWEIIALSASLIIAFPWLTAAFNEVDIDKIRYVLPATGAACVVLGAALWQIGMLLKGTDMKTNALRAALVLPLALLVWMPQFSADAALVQDRRLPERRVELRQWFDINLDPGTIIVGDANHKTFNPIWGGIPHRRWVDWWISNDITEKSPQQWRDEHGISYAVVPADQVQNMENSPEGQAYLAQLLRLRSFVAPPRERGPQMVFFRLWRQQVETDIHFGDAIQLIGYDQDVTQLNPGDSITFRFYWQAVSTPPDNYSLFIHLAPLDSVDAVTQVDGAPAVPERPTLSWNDPGETLISPPFVLTLPADVAPGEYRVLIGLYNYITGQRLTLPDGADTENLTTITVSG